MIRSIGFMATLLLTEFGIALAQDGVATLRIRDVHVVNNVGWGLPLGKTAEILAPRYSSSMGLDVSLIDERFFLYPFLDFLAFRYDQRVADPAFEYQVERGRSNFYALNLAAGVRQRNARWGLYAFAGPGLGLVTEPRATVRSADARVIMQNQPLWGATLRGGSGVDYRLGSVFLFVECGYLHNFRQMQARPLHVLSVYGGLKTNVTRVADRVIEMISDRGG